MSVEDYSVFKLETEPIAISPDLLEKLNHSYIKSDWALQKSTPGAKMEEWEEATVMKSELPAELVNEAVVLQEKPKIDPELFLRRCQKFFGKKVPWRVITTNEGSEMIKSAAQKFGMIYDKGNPGMVLQPIPLSHPKPPETFTIRRVADDREMNDFFTALGISFRIPAFALRASYPKVPEDPISLFVGYAEGKPVSCSALVCVEGIGGIFSVGTDPKARRRGYGEALTWAAIDESRKRGCEASFLQASEMGASIYEKMGFRQVIVYPEWTKRPYAFNRLRNLIYWFRLSRKYRPKLN